MFLFTFIGLTAGNYIGAFVTTNDWQAAFEHSFFQAVALFGAWLTSQVWGKRT